MISDHLKTKRLVSTMSERQYLDAISAPRIDPINQGKNVKISRNWSPDNEEGELSSTTDEDSDEGGRTTNCSANNVVLDTTNIDAT